MGQQTGERGQKRIQRRTVYGDPIVLGERSLVPVADMITLGQARGTIAQDSVNGWGWGAVRIVPRAVIVQEAGGEGRVEIVDATARVVGRLAAAAMGASVALAMARWAIGYLRQRTD